MKDNLFSLVEIEINHSCNLACSYCPNANHERIEKGDMEVDLFETTISQLKDIDYSGLVSFHFYNEPLLSKNLDLYTKRLKEEVPKARLQIYSNGLFLDYERTMELFNIGVDYFVVTKHEMIKNEFVFEKTLERLSDEYKKRILYNDYTEIELNNRGGLIPHLDNEDKDYSQFPCMVASHFIVVTLKGNVLPCYEDFNQTEIMGNVKDTHIRDIWYSERYKKFREQLKKKRANSDSKLCRECNNFRIISHEW